MKWRFRASRFLIVNQSPMFKDWGLPIVRLERKDGRLSAETMERLKGALVFALDLERASE